MKAVELSCIDFTNILASSEPAPGGGGAAGLVGALGTALSMMVGNLTLGKKKYADVEERIKELINECEKIKSSFMDSVLEDEEGFLPLASVYGMKADTDEEKAEKARRMEEGLGLALKAPLKILKLCRDAAPYAREFAEKGSRLAVSDAGCSAAIIAAAAKSAYLNVIINTKLMKNREEAERINKESTDILEETTKLCENVYQNVKDGLING